MGEYIHVNRWAEKAHALDRYRWLLLREHHGVIGSGLRFMRDAIGDWFFGVRAKWRLAQVVAPGHCEFLLLQSAPKVVKLQRKKLLIEGLRCRGYDLVETPLQSRKMLLRNRMFLRPPFWVPTRYFGLAAHAEWLSERYRPRIVLNDRNGSLYAPFLRLSLNERGGTLVHLAHATTVEGSRRLGMNDYDYYFMFGQSSLDALQLRKLRFGSSVAVLAGSHMIDDAYDLPPANPSHRTLLILGVGPDKEKEPGYQATYSMLRAWASENPCYRVLIKAHPRSLASFWRSASEQLRNVEVLARECTLADALRQVSVVVSIMSNAVIEAALARRPIVYANSSGEKDIFAQEQFFGECVTTPQSLQGKLDSIEKHYLASVGASEAFARYHLAHGNQGLEACLDLLENLLNGEPCDGIRLDARWAE